MLPVQSKEESHRKHKSKKNVILINQESIHLEISGYFLTVFCYLFSSYYNHDKNAGILMCVYVYSLILQQIIKKSLTDTLQNKVLSEY